MAKTLKPVTGRQRPPRPSHGLIAARSLRQDGSGQGGLSSGNGGASPARPFGRAGRWARGPSRSPEPAPCRLRLLCHKSAQAAVQHGLRYALGRRGRGVRLVAYPIVLTSCSEAGLGVRFAFIASSPPRSDRSKSSFHNLGSEALGPKSWVRSLGSQVLGPKSWVNVSGQLQRMHFS